MLIFKNFSGTTGSHQADCNRNLQTSKAPLHQMRG